MEVVMQAQRPPRAAARPGDSGRAMKARGWLVIAAAAVAVAALALPLASHAQSAAASQLKPNPEFAKLPQYTGTLGKRPIVMRLGAKTDDDDPTGVHGEYQFTDTGEVNLIAGDRDGATLEAEDSNDGTHISGNWVGTFAEDGALTGERMEPDDSNPVPFDLKPVAQGSTAAAAPVSASTPASASKGGQAVNGVGNLVIGQ
ncbi:hypothetical protein C7402_1258 [Paraburkholderia unamae]|uniref:Uncharacterized protein n=2 Tax=Paraburkholderia unamae TaxID=219649 RepID=A0ABX5KG41_9BURK|nr:hypothetical protein C7402_1258 [Paraburkholderia unamae]CAG9258979.1 conserved hypothetical protein [Paraburkholderia unamae]